MIWLLAGGLGAFIVLLAFRNTRKRGEAEANAKQSEKVLDNVEKANKAVIDLNDPAVRKRLRDKYTHK